jgi:hypothetical protein
MNSATIPIAALVTFAGVYWLTPAPVAAPRSAPDPIVDAPVPVAVAAERSRPSAVPASKRAAARRSRPARPPVKIAGRANVERPVRPVRSAPVARVYFSGCNEVRAAGLAPLFRGQPGYRPEMDGDDDGIACEPHRRRHRRG